MPAPSPRRSPRPATRPGFDSRSKPPGERFVATRVVRRDGKGRVKTGAAGLQRMPPGFDPRRFDTGLTPDDLGEVLAGTPSEMDAAVPEVLGLPYDQFVTCVVLPQGEFAEFLHAKPATRQQILVNLLNLSVYGSIRERAVARASKAEAELTAAQRLLTDLADADEAALARAESRLSAVTTLAEAVERGTATARRRPSRPGTGRLAGSQEHDARDRRARRRPATEVGGRAGRSRRHRPRRAGRRHRGGHAGRGAGGEAPGCARQRRGRRGAPSPAQSPRGAPTTRHAGRHGHTKRSRRPSRNTPQHPEALAAARADAEKTAAELEAAREAYTRAQTADLAAAVRTHLVAGQPCPVCEQPVSHPPPQCRRTPRWLAPKRPGKAARARADAAARRLQERDAALRALDRTLAAARAQADTLADRLAASSDAPTRRRARAGVTAPGPGRITEAEAAVGRGHRGRYAAARESHRRAQSEVESAEHQLRAGWREFDQVRDALAPHPARPRSTGTTSPRPGRHSRRGRASAPRRCGKSAHRWPRP